MRRLGTVLHISRRGSIIVRTDKTPPMRAQVVNKKVEQVGKIADVFGPVKKPYVSIRPSRGVEAKSYVGQPLYLLKRRK